MTRQKMVFQELTMEEAKLQASVFVVAAAIQHHYAAGKIALPEDPFLKEHLAIVMSNYGACLQLIETLRESLVRSTGKEG